MTITMGMIMVMVIMTEFVVAWHSGTSTNESRVNWNLVILVFVEDGKRSKQGWNPTTKLTHMPCWVWELILGHISERTALSQLHHSAPPTLSWYMKVPAIRGGEWSKTLSPNFSQISGVFSKLSFPGIPPLISFKSISFEGWKWLRLTEKISLLG